MLRPFLHQCHTEQKVEVFKAEEGHFRQIGSGAPVMAQQQYRHPPYARVLLSAAASPPHRLPSFITPVLAASPPLSVSEGLQ